MSQRTDFKGSQTGRYRIDTGWSRTDKSALFDLFKRGRTSTLNDQLGSPERDSQASGFYRDFELLTLQ